MRAKGIDISNWQGKFTPQGNIDFAIIKATEGLAVDSMFPVNLAAVQSHRICGCYHYFRTNFKPIEQAEFFHEKTAGFDFLVVDYERKNNQLDAFGEGNLKLFWDHLSGLTKKPVLLYTNPYIYRDHLCNLRSFWKSVPLWMAHYNGQDPETGSPEVFDGSGWLLWQYSADGNGKGGEFGVESGDVDLNVFNGTMEEMVETFRIKESDPVKKPWNSKTITFFILTLLVSLAGLFGFVEYQPTPEQAQLIGVIVSLVGIVLRALTREGIEL